MPNALLCLGGPLDGDVFAVSRHFGTVFCSGIVYSRHHVMGRGPGGPRLTVLAAPVVSDARLEQARFVVALSDMPWIPGPGMLSRR